MAHLKCLACETRLHSTESRSDPIGDLCPVCGSLLEPVGDLSEIFGYRVIEDCGSTSHSSASVAGQLIADRVGEITARRELKPSSASTTRAPRAPFAASAADAPTGGPTPPGDPPAA